MRGGLYVFAAAFGVSAAAGITVQSIRTAHANTLINIANQLRISSTSLPLLTQWIFAPLAIHQLFDEFHTLEIQKLHILFLTPVQRHADLPGASEDVGILNCRLVGNHVGAGA